MYLNINATQYSLPSQFRVIHGGIVRSNLPHKHIPKQSLSGYVLSLVESSMSPREMSEFDWG